MNLKINLFTVCKGLAEKEARLCDKIVDNVSETVKEHHRCHDWTRLMLQVTILPFCSQSEGLKQEDHDDGEGVNSILPILVFFFFLFYFYFSFTILGTEKGSTRFFSSSSTRGELLVQFWSEYSDTLPSLQSGAKQGKGFTLLTRS